MNIQEHLFLFIEDVTISFRSIWGRDLSAAVRSIVNTGKRQGLSAFESIKNALSPPSSFSFPSRAITIIY